MVPGANLDGFGEKQISLLLPGFEPWTTQPVARCYTDCYPSQFLTLVKNVCTQHFIYKYLCYMESNLKLINVHVQWDLILTRLLYI